MTQRDNHPKEHRRMPNPRRATLTAILALTAAITAVGCTREVVVQQPTANNNASSAITTTSSAPAHSAMNDKAKLCSLFSSRAQDFIQAVKQLQTATSQHQDWKWSEPDISAAGDKVVDSIKNFETRLKDTIGDEIPQNAADAMRELMKAADGYSQVVEQRANTSEELNAAFNALYKAEGDFDVACGFKSN